MLRPTKRLVIDSLAISFVGLLIARGLAVSGDRRPFGGPSHTALSALATNLVLLVVLSVASADLFLGIKRGGLLARGPSLASRVRIQGNRWTPVLAFGPMNNQALLVHATYLTGTIEPVRLIYRLSEIAQAERDESNAEESTRTRELDANGFPTDETIIYPPSPRKRFQLNARIEASERDCVEIEIKCSPTPARQNVA